MIALLVAAALPSTGLASRASSGGRELDGVVYLAAPGEINRIETSESGATVTIRDPGAVIVAGGGCTRVDDHEVRCAGGAGIPTDLFLGDRGDTATIVQGGASAHGEGGNDILSACSSCQANFFGGPGSDLLTGNRASNFIRGGGGDDTILARGGDDVIEPGAGDDTVDAGSGRRDLLDFTAPSRQEGVVVNLRTGVARGQGEDTIVGAEHVAGTRFGDVLVGDSLDNLLDGAGGSDTLFAGRGADRLRGGGDNDVLAGGPGRDRLRGERGHDRLRARDGMPDLVRGGLGNDWARVDRRDDVRGVERGA